MKRISPFAALLLLACCSAKTTNEKNEEPTIQSAVPSTVTSAEVASAVVPSAEVASAEAPSAEVASAEVASAEVPSAVVPSAGFSSAEISAEVASAEVASADVPSAEVPSAEVPSAEVASAVVPSAEVPWGDKGTLVSTSASVSVHARIYLKDVATNSEPVVDLGEAVSQIYAKQNTGHEIMQVWHAVFWPNHRILVLDAAGKTLDMTEMGKSGLAAFSPRAKRDKNIEWALKPGEVDISEGSYDLATLFTFTEVGRYTVRGDYEEQVRILSNTLPIWLAPKGTTTLLEKLNGWDAEEADVIERPDEYPGRIAAGESNGYIDSQKEALDKLGVTVRWVPQIKRYQIESILTP